MVGELRRTSIVPLVKSYKGKFEVVDARRRLGSWFIVRSWIEDILQHRKDFWKIF